MEQANMEVTKFSHTLWQFLNIFAANLQFRLSVIEATGQQGQADDIREVTAQIHYKALAQTRKVINKWHAMSYNMQLAFYHQVRKYVANMVELEGNSITMLEQMRKQLQDANGDAAQETFVTRAFSAHKRIFRYTDGMQAMLEWLHANEPTADLKLASQVPEVPPLLDPELAAKRAELIDKATRNIVGAPKARM
jgi:hypothetical protein